MKKSPKVILICFLVCVSGFLYAQHKERYTTEIFKHFNTLQDVQYGEAVDQKGENEKLLLDIYQPGGDKLKKRPLVVFLHGGGFKNGDKAKGYPILFCEGLVKRGFVCSAVNYRLGVAEPQTDTTTFDAMYRAVQDAKAAVRFFRKNAGKYGIDTDHIFIMGGSAGSIAALHLAYMNQEEVPAFVNTAVLGTLEGNSGHAGYSSKVNAVVNCWGAMVDYHWISNGDIPLFNIHGINDKSVPYDSAFSAHGSRYGSRILYERALSLGISAGIKLFENTGHTLDSDKEKQNQALDEACRWLYALLQEKKLPVLSGTFMLNPEVLRKNKKQILANNPGKKAALSDLLSTADKILKAGRLYSVLDKDQTPPSGDKHDYMSTGPYWWPDSSKVNGLPYIRKDGQRNPEYYRIPDNKEIDFLINDVEVLALSYYYTGNEKYAGHASKLINTWFIDKETRQNPNLNFGQGIPGINTGRGIGIIETRELYRLVDGSILLNGSKYWASAQQHALQDWFAAYLRWLLQSSNGKDESDAHNNHGTYYSVQVISFALFTGNQDIAKKEIEHVKNRMNSQLKPDGSQPFELERTKSWGYVNMNLWGFCVNARLAEHVKSDLWQYQTPGGAGIKKCVDWMIPFLKKEREWPYEQIDKKKYEETVRILKMVSKKYADPAYEGLAKKADEQYYLSAINQLKY